MNQSQDESGVGLSADNDSENQSSSSTSSSSWKPPGSSSSSSSALSSSSSSSDGKRRSKRARFPRRFYQEDEEYIPKKSKAAKSGRPKQGGKKKGVEKEEPKSELELLREKNINERKSIIEQLGLMQTKSEMEKSTKRAKITPKVKKEEDIVPVLRETRSNRRAAEVARLEKSRASDDKSANKSLVPKDLAQSLTVRECVSSAYKEEDVSLFIEVAKLIEEETSKMVSESELSSMQFPVLKSRVSALCLNKNLACPDLLNSKFTSLAFHPSTSPLLLAGGTKNGSLCLWKISTNHEKSTRWSTQSQIVSFTVHSSTINHLAFGASLPHFLFLNSKDGCLKSMDLNQEQFTLIYKAPQHDQPSWINWHTIVSPYVIVAATNQGNLLRFDTREDNQTSFSHLSEFKCHQAPINTVDVFGGSSVLTASDDGSFSLWDLNVMQGSQVSPLLDSDGMVSGRKWTMATGGPVSSAFFSPQGASRLLVSAKDVVSVYDHGHDLAPFKTFSACGTSGQKKGHVPKAFWHPMRKDVFLFGLSQPPMTGVQIFHAKHVVKPSVPCQADIFLRDTSTAKAIFHPTRMLIASCSGSKIHFYQ